MIQDAEIGYSVLYCSTEKHCNPDSSTGEIGCLLTLCLPVSSADNLGKQFGPRSGSKPFVILMVFLKEFFQKINF